MATWIYFLHPPRENFAATMTEHESAVFQEHFGYVDQLQSEGTLILVGVTLGTTNTGMAVFQVEDRAAAESVMLRDPVVASGVGRGELREFQLVCLASEV